MKKFSLWALLLMFSIIGLQSCKEDIVADEGQNQDDLSGMTARGAAPSAISKLSYKDRFGNKQDILSFATKADFTNTLSELEQLYNDNLDAENEYASVLGFDNEFGFKSLLLDYVAAEESWLMTEDLPDATDPDNLFYDLDIEELAVLNKERAVKIGDDILVYFKDGFVGIRNSNFNVIKDVIAYNSLAELYADSQNHTDANARSFWGWLFWPITVIDLELDYDGSDNCREQRSFHKNHYDVTARIKYKFKVKYRRYNPYLFKKAALKVKMKALKKRRWFGWKRIKTTKYVTLTQEWSVGKCAEGVPNPLTSSFEYTKVFRYKWIIGGGTLNYYFKDNRAAVNFYSEGNLIKSIDPYDGHFYN